MKANKKAKYAAALKKRMKKRMSPRLKARRGRFGPNPPGFPGVGSPGGEPVGT